MVNVKEVRLALKIADQHLSNRWAAIQANDSGVRMEIGPVNSRGEREFKSATYTFYSDADGTPHFNVYAHP